jgi:hypothetical protein
MTEFTDIVLERSNTKDIKITAILLASVSTEETNGRYEQYCLYKTSSNKIVLHCQFFTRWQGENRVLRVSIYNSPEQCMEEFGIDDTKKQLYKKAGFDVTEILI